MLMKDLRTKSREELHKLVDDLKAELFLLRFKNSTNQLNETHKINLTRKDIARVLTVLHTKKAVITGAKSSVVKDAPSDPSVKDDAAKVKNVKKLDKNKKLKRLSTLAEKVSAFKKVKSAPKIVQQVNVDDIKESEV